MKNMTWSDWLIAVMVILIFILFAVFIPMAIKENTKFREDCSAKHGVTITGRDIKLCVVDGKIVDGN